MRIEKICVGDFGVNCYILVSTKNRAILIDPGAESDRLKKFLDQNRIKPSFILHTHGHMDHIGADTDLSLPVYIHKYDQPLLKDPILNLSQLFIQPIIVDSEIITFNDLDIINLDEISLKVIHTPGHTSGSSCFLLNNQKKILFSGDTLFYLSIGRTDFPGGSQKELIRSIKEKLLVLEEETIVYPGHGPSTTIKKEKDNNPFLK